jgi:hypothetical protein
MAVGGLFSGAERQIRAIQRKPVSQSSFAWQDSPSFPLLDDSGLQPPSSWMDTHNKKNEYFNAL